MGVVLTREAHERIVSAVRWVEANRRGPQPPAAGPRVSTCEAIWCRVTSATVDGDGRYPAVITLYDPTAGTWSDYSAVKLQPPNGETLIDERRYLARPAGADGSDEVYIVASAADGLAVGEVDTSPMVLGVVQITFDQADGFTVTDSGSGQVRIDLVAATATQAGGMSTTTQTFAGDKTFQDDVISEDGFYARTQGNAAYDAYTRLESKTDMSSTPYSEWHLIVGGGTGYGGLGLFLVASIVSGSVAPQVTFSSDSAQYPLITLDRSPSTPLIGQTIGEAGVSYQSGLRVGSGTLSIDGGTW